VLAPCMEHPEDILLAAIYLAGKVKYLSLLVALC
jgi:hypothetical protein